MNISTILPLFMSNAGPGNACRSLLGSYLENGVDAELHCISTSRALRRDFERYAVSPWLAPVAYRLASEQALARLTEKKFLAALRPTDIAYLWPGASLELFHAVKRRGNPLVTEFINTHRATGEAILASERLRLGLPTASEQYLHSQFAYDDTRIALCDLIFSESPEMTKSLQRAGCPVDRIIESSLGLESKSVLPRSAADRPERRSALFVGTMSMRKGAHLLLEYWRIADVDAQLTLVGPIDPEIAPIVAPHLGASGIRHIPFSNDLTPLYENADVFLFPSLEEGSPLVTYMSLGAGLAAIVSPMGSGGAVRDGIEGIVLDPHDREGWVNAIRRAFSDRGTRDHFARNSHSRADHFRWKAIGQRRLAELRARL